MRLRLLAIWVSLALLLQWSRAQEDNIQEVSISGGSEGESSDKNEDQETEMKENGVGLPGESQTFMNTTELPTDDKDSVMGTQSGEDKNQPDEISVGTNSEMDHKTEAGAKEPEKESTVSSSPPETLETNKDDTPSENSDVSPTSTQESSSEVEPNILNQPPTSAEGNTHPANETAVISAGGSPDYPSNGPQGDTTPRPTTETTLAPLTPAISDPSFAPLTCYSCMFCNQTTKNETKSNCPPIPGKRNGCRTILVRDPFVVPGKRNYLSRGCISELEISFPRYCDDNKKLCSTCYEDNCNIHNMTQFEETPGTATANQHQLAPFLIWSICLFSWQGLY
ncbi:uncharacterized protein [Drosophila takahashii]|uniref:uncharacterized protein n=1 Tax=Drosophila takahashii TaxID=29030 RepID=UPI001CF7FC77|nr:uncharacterized protein LOC108059362 [Drosophila takahashii]